MVWGLQLGQKMEIINESEVPQSGGWNNTNMAYFSISNLCRLPNEQGKQVNQGWMDPWPHGQKKGLASHLVPGKCPSSPYSLGKACWVNTHSSDFCSDPSTQVLSSDVVSETWGIVLKDDQRKLGQTCQDPVMCHTQVKTRLSGLKNK